MNAPILKLFGLVLVLFGALAAMTSYNSVINAEAVPREPLNARPQIEEQRIQRGVIRARDGSVLARSVRGDGELYSRRYTPRARSFAHVIGYDFLRIGRGGPRARAQRRADRQAQRADVDRRRAARQAARRRQRHHEPRPAARSGWRSRALQGRKGSVVAIEPATGKVRVMASTPGYDPNALDDDGVFERLSSDDDNSPLLNRATQAGYAPGSTMKVVTAAAALDSGQFHARFDWSREVADHRLRRAAERTSPTSSSAPITLTTALTNSVNTVWAQVAEKLGRERMADYMERFGFGADPPLDYPDSQMFAQRRLRPRRKKLIPADSEQRRHRPRRRSARSACA